MTERAELFRALGAVIEPPSPALAPMARALDLPSVPDVAEHSETFLFQLYPYASVYTGAEGMLGGEAADRVAGFWRAIGAVPPAEPDHLVALLGLYAGLTGAEEQEADEARHRMWREARRALLWEHLLSWLPIYLDKVGDIGGRFYREWAALVRTALAAELGELGPLERLPLHLRSVGGFPPAESPARELLPAILAPARSGMVLTRADIARGAATIGVGLRMGERRFVLEAMFGQDARGTLEWLAGEAAGWEARHLDRVDVHGVIARHWTERAAAAGAFFVSSSAAVKGVVPGGAGHQ